MIFNIRYFFVFIFMQQLGVNTGNNAKLIWKKMKVVQTVENVIDNC